MQPPSRSGLTIVSLAKNYKMAARKGAKLQQGRRKPLEGYITLNTDASYDNDVGCGSTGAMQLSEMARVV